MRFFANTTIFKENSITKIEIETYIVFNHNNSHKAHNFLLFLRHFRLCAILCNSIFYSYLLQYYYFLFTFLLSVLLNYRYIDI